MRLAIIGATGFIGGRLARKALEAGHEVRALVRRPLADLDGRIEVVRGDMSMPGALAELASGVAAIVSTAGPPRTGRHDSAPYGAAMQALVAAAAHAGVRRLITIAGAAARLPGERLGVKRTLLRWLLSTIVMPDVIRTKDIESRIVAGSSLDWTIVRPPIVRQDAPTGTVFATDTDLAGLGVDVEDLADFILGLLGSTEWVRRAPTVASHANKAARRAD